MEALIGFAVGYWVGSRQGRKGLSQALEEAREIWASPETRRLLGEGLSALEGLSPIGKRRRDTGNALIHGVIDEIMTRRAARQAASAA